MEDLVEVEAGRILLQSQMFTVNVYVGTASSWNQLQARECITLSER